MQATSVIHADDRKLAPDRNHARPVRKLPKPGPRRAQPHGGRRRRRPAISFDVNYRPALWDEPPGDLLRELAAAADIVFVGLDEASALWGATVHGPADVRDLLPDPRIVVVKDAAVGATAFHPGGATHVPSLRVEVVEPVGAGDAFAAGFLAALLGGGDAVRCLRSGHLTAASALTVAGDHGPLPDLATRERLLAADEMAWATAAR